MHQSQTSGGDSWFPRRMGYTGTMHGGRAADRVPGRQFMADEHTPGNETTEPAAPADRPASPSSPWEPGPSAPSPWAPTQSSPWAAPPPPPPPPGPEAAVEPLTAVESPPSVESPPADEPVTAGEPPGKPLASAHAFADPLGEQDA